MRMAAKCAVGVAGVSRHPLTRGALCPLAFAAHQLNWHPRRLRESAPCRARGVVGRGPGGLRKSLCRGTHRHRRWPARKGRFVGVPSLHPKAPRQLPGRAERGESGARALCRLERRSRGIARLRSGKRAHHRQLWRANSGWLGNTRPVHAALERAGRRRRRPATAFDPDRAVIVPDRGARLAMGSRS